MSVVEFMIAASLALVALFAGHEIIRISAIERAADLIIHSAASSASLTSLSHIALNTFEGDGRVESSFEEEIKRTIGSGLSEPILHWSFFSRRNAVNGTTVTGIRTYVRGPTQKQPFTDFHLSAHICISSWLEMFLTRTNRNRNCLGQFTSNQRSKNIQSSGVLVSVSASRSVPYWIPTFFLGLQND